MSLYDVWEGAARSPFFPLVSKDSQFFVGFTLLLAGELFSDICDMTSTNLNKASF